MSRLAQDQSGAPVSAPARPVVMTAERWVGVLLLGSFAFLVFTRAKFAEFVPS